MIGGKTMSGPKISVYSLTGRARTIVVGQMRCEQQSLACATQTQAILKSLSSFSGNFDQQLQNVQLLIKRTGGGAEQVEKINHLQETLKHGAKEIERELSANMPRVSTKYRITEEAYEEKQAELKKLQALQKRAEKLKNATKIKLPVYKKKIVDKELENVTFIKSQIEEDINAGKEMLKILV